MRPRSSPGTASGSRWSASGGTRPGGALLEIPAGTLEPGEPPEETARRELAEECGLAAATWEAGPQFFTAPGFCTELMHLYLATDLTDAPGQADPDEQLEPSWMSLADAVAAVDDGRIADSKTHGRRRLAGPSPRPLRTALARRLPSASAA